MKKTLVIGANGQIGKIVVELLHNQDRPVVAMVRSKQQAEKLENIGVEAVIGDLETDFEHAFKGCDKVVFSAGSGGNTGDDKTLLIDLWAAKKAVDYSLKEGIQHFVMVSGLGAQDPDEFESEIKPYLVAKYFADQYLLSSGLNYTILRPGSLTNDKGNGLITTTRSTSTNDLFISREDVAKSIEYCINRDEVSNQIFELYHGNEVISSALTASN
ncbi:SDR family oxidoreductase [uncultured Psychromonas sp.]|uniref:SDR family oxidoreductase n=1 Tax=uncultured Psychromonas sp. TaxID=173974 RepID=UPI002604CA11|nr:SDR family oxidoreductase [uncultured Psychromonas sp.]